MKRSAFDRAVRELRIFRTLVVHILRAKLGLYKDEARDRMINGTRADQDELAKAFVELSKQHARTVAQLNHALTRLDYYEQNVPWLGDLRKDFDREHAEEENTARDTKRQHAYGILELVKTP